MQNLDSFILENLKALAQKKFGQKQFESQFGELKLLSNGDKLECPICHYQSKKNRVSARIYKDNGETSFKCFACGAWRLVK